VLANFIALLYFEYHEPSLYNFSAMFNTVLIAVTLLITLYLLAVIGILKLVIVMCKKRKFGQLLLVFILALLSLYWIPVSNITTSADWGDGVIGKHLNTESGCSIIKP
jgi:energy-coupling factor transporter transmembrane protein EcfT